jgi:hypothetical protein
MVSAIQGIGGAGWCAVSVSLQNAERLDGRTSRQDKGSRVPGTGAGWRRAVGGVVDSRARGCGRDGNRNTSIKRLACRGEDRGRYGAWWRRRRWGSGGIR